MNYKVANLASRRSVAGITFLAAGASLCAYRWYARAVTLTIAVGSIDGEAKKVVSAIASRLASTAVRGDADAMDVTTLNVAAHRLENFDTRSPSDTRGVRPFPPISRF